MEGVLDLDGMEKIKQSVSNYLENLELINAVLLDQGKGERFAAVEINNYLNLIKEKIDHFAADK
jgi:hypothetical protein